MKKYIVFVICLVFLIPTVLFAEEATNIDSLLLLMKFQKEEVVAKNMELTETEQRDFWQLYEEYQGKLREVDDRLVGILTRYIEASESMMEQRANELLQGYLDAEKERLRLKESYVEKFNEILPPKKVVRYFYLESKLEALKSVSFSAALPLIY